MSFSFNFVPDVEQASGSDAMDTSEEGFAGEGERRVDNRNTSFSWIESSLPKEYPENDSIPLAPRQQQGVGTIDDYILRVREASASFRDRNTDLVPGVYEGGLKVWECSVDMCRYFLDHNVNIEGHVLELGCGHGLPGIFLLKKAIARSEQNAAKCSVTFSDYNEFVIKDVTMPNVVLNARDAYSKRANSVDGPQNIERWLRMHTAFGAGDWFGMSDLLLEKDDKSISMEQSKHAALPKGGLFDCILASETTYSETAAMETAELLSRHLKPGKGIAYISTKRYYFGVGGGTKCFCDALNKQKGHKFHVETLEVYDNGAGNIRELLLVKSLGPVNRPV